MAVGDVVWVVVGGAVWVPGGVAVWVPGGVAVAVVFAVDSVFDRDVPHPTALMSNKTHKRTANPLTFAG